MKKLVVLIGGLLALSACHSDKELRAEQMRINGKELYEKHCANCHQVDGTGLGKLFPPIQKEYLTPTDRLICLIRKGSQGQFTVNGQKYSQAMPANPHLYDLDIAALATYLHSRWGASEKVIETAEVKKALENCK